MTPTSWINKMKEEHRVKEELSVTPYQVLFWALAHDVSDVKKQSCYDEEGVEGWLYTARDGSEDCPLGDWSETPPFPGESWFLKHVFSKFQEAHDYYEVTLSERVIVITRCRECDGLNGGHYTYCDDLKSPF